MEEAEGRQNIKGNRINPWNIYHVVPDASPSPFSKIVEVIKRLEEITKEIL